MFKFGLGQDIGIDLGTATVIAYVKGKGVVLRDPSVVAVDSNTKEVLAVGQEARRMLVDTDVDLCLINAPLRKESGEQLSIDIAEKNICQVILFVKAEQCDAIADCVEDYGVITVSKPISRQLFWSAIKLARVAQRRITMAQKENAKLQQKLDGLKTVSRAKCLLISYCGMSEEDAHKYIERQAMDKRLSRLEIAKDIVHTYG